MGGAIAKGSSSVVTRSSPRKNEDMLHCRNSASSAPNVAPSFHWRASSVKSKDSELHCWFSQREKSFR